MTQPLLIKISYTADQNKSLKVQSIQMNVY